MPAIFLFARPDVRMTQYRFVSTLMLGLMLMTGPVWADCQTSYDQAITLLDSTTQKASRNEHPNPDSFSTEFKTIVSSMQTQKCMPELMSLIQHIQSEQQKIPSGTDAASQGKNSAITDTD